MDNFVIQTYGKRRENQGVLGGVIFVELGFLDYFSTEKT